MLDCPEAGPEANYAELCPLLSHCTFLPPRPCCICGAVCTGELLSPPSACLPSLTPSSTALLHSLSLQGDCYREQRQRWVHRGQLLRPRKLGCLQCGNEKSRADGSRADGTRGATARQNIGREEHTQKPKTRLTTNSTPSTTAISTHLILEEPRCGGVGCSGACPGAPYTGI